MPKFADGTEAVWDEQSQSWVRGGVAAPATAPAAAPPGPKFADGTPAVWNEKTQSWGKANEPISVTASPKGALDTHFAPPAESPPEFNPAGADPISGKATLMESIQALLPSGRSALQSLAAPMLLTGEDARNFLIHDNSNTDSERLALLQQKYPQYQWSVDPKLGITATDDKGRKAVLDAPGIASIESLKRGVATMGPAIIGGALASLSGPQDAGPGAIATQAGLRGAVRALTGMAGRSMARALPQVAAGSIATHTARDLARTQAGQQVPDAASTVGNEAIDTALGTALSPPLEAAGSLVAAGARRLVAGARGATTPDVILKAIGDKGFNTENADPALLTEAARLVDKEGYKDPAQAYTVALWQKLFGKGKDATHTLDTAKLQDNPQLLNTLEALRNSDMNPFGAELLQARQSADKKAIEQLAARVEGDASKSSVRVGDIPAALMQKEADSRAAVDAAFAKMPSGVVLRPGFMSSAASFGGDLETAARSAAVITPKNTPYTADFLAALKKDRRGMPFEDLQSLVRDLRENKRAGLVKGADYKAANAVLDALEADGGVYSKIGQGDLIANSSGGQFDAAAVRQSLEDARTLARQHNDRFGRTELGKGGFYATEYRGDAGIGGGPNVQVPVIGPDVFVKKVFGAAPEDFTQVQGGVVKDLVKEFGAGSPEVSALQAEAQSRIGLRLDKANTPDALSKFERDISRSRSKYETLLDPEYWTQVQESVNAKRVLLRSGNASQGQKFEASKLTPAISGVAGAGIGSALPVPGAGAAAGAALGYGAGKVLAKRSAAKQAKAMTDALLGSNPSKRQIEALFVQYPALRTLAPALDQSIGLFNDR